MTQRSLLFAMLVAWIAAVPARAQESYVDSAALSAFGFQTFWQLEAPLLPGQIVERAYLVDDQVYLGTNDGYVFAIDAITGAVRWSRQVITGGYHLQRPAHAGDRALFTIPSAVLQYDRITGRPVQKTNLWFAPGASAVAEGDNMYLGGINGRIYAIRVDRSFETWMATARSAVVSRLSMFEGNLYFATDDGHVYSCDAQTKSLYWQAPVVSSVTAPLVVNETGVYVPTLANALVALAPFNGGLRWTAQLGGALEEGPQATNELVFQWTREDGMCAIESGGIAEVEKRIRWKLPEGRTLLTTNDEYAFIQTLDRDTAVVRQKDGEVVYRIDTKSFDLPMSATDQNAVFLASSDGRVVNLRPRELDKATREQIRRSISRPVELAQGTGAPDSDKAAAVEPNAPETATAGAGETVTAAEALESKDKAPPLGGKSKVTKRLRQRSGRE